jgi:cytochrome c2
MKRISLTAITIFLASSFAFYSCSSNNAQGSEQTGEEPSETNAETQTANSGFQIEEVQLSSPLNAEWVSGGKSIYELKCQSCHKLTDEKLVGPGWKGVTQKRKAGWILAMITNPDELLNNDADAQKLLEECLVRMPNQNVSKEDGLKLLEFMRSNDGEK